MYLTEQITVFGQHEENTLKQIERCICPLQRKDRPAPAGSKTSASRKSKNCDHEVSRNVLVPSTIPRCSQAAIVFVRICVRGKHITQKSGLRCR
jgi:hypothetical protein